MLALLPRVRAALKRFYATERGGRSLLRLYAYKHIFKVIHILLCWHVDTYVCVYEGARMFAQRVFCCSTSNWRKV